MAQTLIFSTLSGKAVYSDSASPEEMPRNTTGKILHRVLRDMLAERASAHTKGEVA